MDQSPEKPNSTYDWILLAVTLAATLPFLIANGALIVWRSRRYFQAQGGAFLIVGSSVAGLIWIFSGFYANGHFQKASFLNNKCALWSSASLGLGIGCWFIFTMIRLRRMYHLSIDSTRDSRCRCYAVMILYMLPILILILTTVILSTASQSLEERYHSDTCVLRKKWRLIAWLTSSAPYMVVNLIFLWMLRGQTDPLMVTEYMHYCEYLVMAFIIVILAGVAVSTDGSDSISGRCFLTFCTACLVFSHFWVRFGYPVYLCLFKPKTEMDKLEEELSESGARALQAGNSSYTHAPYPPSSEGAVMEALYKATNELDVSMSIVLKLKKDKEMLQKSVRELELRRVGNELRV